MIRTVTGDIAGVHGRILAHEHLQIDLSAQKGPANRIGEAEEQAVVDDLRRAKEFGLAAITDLSAPDWGRNPVALRRISEQAGVAVVCAAGFYWDPFPGVAIDGTLEQLRDIMISELETGVGGTDIRCGVIKVGTNRGEPDDVAQRLFRAAVGAAFATGAPVITHTSSPDQAAWHVRVLERAGMDMSRVVISHMGAAADVSELVEVARSGVFMGIDKVSFPKGPTNDQLADLVRDACERGLERQIILSSDIARRTLLRRYGGRGYGTVFADFVPMRGVWTRERIALLKKLWADGETATAIAARLRMSRSAVLGKVFRLRLRPAANATTAAARRNTKILRRRHKSRSPNKHRAKPAAAAAPAIASGKTLFELTNDSCRWPHGQPGTKTFHFCGALGADLEGGRPYCERHARRAYVGHSKTAATATLAGVDPPIASPSIVPSGVKRHRPVLSQGRKRS